MNKIGEILLLYIVGILLSNLVVFPLGLGDSLKGIQDGLTSVMILLAFPMILFGCDFNNWKLKKAVVALCVGLFSVLVVDIAGYYIFNDNQSGFEKIADDKLIYKNNNNYHSLVKVKIDKEVSKIVVKLNDTWGSENINIFACDFIKGEI